MTTKDKIERIATTDEIKKFVEMLRNICDEEDFVHGTLLVCNTSEKRQRLWNYIDQHNITDAQDVMKLSYCIYSSIEPDFI